MSTEPDKARAMENAETRNDETMVVANGNPKATRTDSVPNKSMLLNKEIFLKKRRINREIRNYISNIASKVIIYLLVERNNYLREERSLRRGRPTK